MNRLRIVVPLLLLALLLVYLVWGQIRCPGAGPEQEGYAFKAMDLITGKQVKFPDDFKGQVVYLNYFSNT